MSYHQLKRDAEARATLAQAQASFEASDLGGIFWKGPTDWPQCRILLREADALLERNSNAVTQVNAMAQSQYSLGLMYLNGDGVSQDWAQAVVSFRNAAEQGHAGAQYSLGWMYANGKGTAMDSAEALKWFRKSADQGYASAQYALGCIYANGDGVTIDPVEAAKWFRKAADPAQTLRIKFSLPRP
jgi:TPR repeat protein